MRISLIKPPLNASQKGHIVDKNREESAPAKRNWTPSPELARRREVIARMHAAGSSAPAIARQVGCSVRTVERYRASLRAEPIGATPPKVAERERAAQLIAQGVHITEVARTVRVSDTTVAKWFPDAPRMTPREIGLLSVVARRHRDVFSLQVNAGQ